MRAHNSGSQGNDTISDLPPFSPPTFFATILHYGGKKTECCRCSGGKVKRTGVGCIKPTYSPDPVCEQVWLSRTLWSKL